MKHLIWDVAQTKKIFIKEPLIFKYMIIKKIFEGNFDEEVHSDFLKFGKGDYRDKYMIEGKKQAKGWTIKTGPEFANHFVRTLLEKFSEPVHVKGVVVSTIDFSKEAEFGIGKVGNFQGVRKMQIDTEIEPSKILEFMDKFPRAFFALSFSGDNFVLKIKPKAPKSGKPGKDSDEGPKVDFCSLKTNDSEIVKEIFFGVGEFKEVRISHKIIIDSIVYPDNVNSLKPEEIREQSKRKGFIERKAIVDGVEKVSKAEFVV